jgi:fibrillarin-like pre-rRNA processing protein
MEQEIEQRSKWFAAQKLGLNLGLKGDENILYLGASTGTTVSELSKLTSGIIFAVENSPEMAIPLVKLAFVRKNIAPIFCDARNVSYLKKALHDTKIDILFQDIPARDQIEILIKNSLLVDKDCRILFSLKTQSISQEDSGKTAQLVKEKLQKEFKVLEIKNLEKYHKKHYFFLLKKKI